MFTIEYHLLSVAAGTVCSAAGIAAWLLWWRARSRQLRHFPAVQGNMPVMTIKLQLPWLCTSWLAARGRVDALPARLRCHGLDWQQQDADSPAGQES